MHTYLEFIKALNEGRIPREEFNQHGKEPVNIMAGRYQPFHLGHLSIAQELNKQNGLRVVIFIVRGTQNPSNKTIFSPDLTNRIVDSVIEANKELLADKFNIPRIIFPAFILPNMRPKYEPVLLGAGDDRYDGYKLLTDEEKTNNRYNVRPDLDTYLLKRQGGFVAEISATKVREAIAANDFQTFKKYVPREVHKYFEELKREYNSKK